MTLHNRFILLFAALGIGFGASVVWIRDTHEREVAQLRQEEREQRQVLLDRVLDLTRYPLSQFARDYSLWDDMVTFVGNPSADWAKINLTASLDTFRLSSVIVYRPDGTVVFEEKAASAPPTALGAINGSSLLATVKGSPFAHFFVRVGADVYDVQAAPIQPSADAARSSNPKGWLVALRHWDKTHLDTIGHLMQETVALDLTSSAGSNPSPRVSATLRNLEGARIAVLEVDNVRALSAKADEFNQQELAILIAQGFLSFGLVFICLDAWVLRPYRKLAASLQTQDGERIDSLTERRDENGEIARLLQRQFAERAALEQNQQELTLAVEERVRLGRDLHDGVIQSLYAGGMGLVAAKNALRENPGAAEARLDDIRTLLNETIRRVRAFITELEPTAARQKQFSQAIDDLVITMRSTIKEVELTLDVDDVAAARLSLELRVAILQFLRELLDHCLRERRSERIVIGLRAEGDTIAVDINEAGSGAGSSLSGGRRGLEEAAIALRNAGLKCQITPAPGGLHAKVVVPSSSPL